MYPDTQRIRTWTTPGPVGGAPGPIAGLIRGGTSFTIAPTKMKLNVLITAAGRTMARRLVSSLPCALRLVILALLLGVHSQGAAAQTAEPPAAAALRDRFTALRNRPESSPFGLPLYLQAQESDGRVQGDVYALIDLPYREARPTLERIDDWCRILTLHINVKYCRPAERGHQQALTIGVAPKYEQSLSSVNWVRFAVEATNATDGYLRIGLHAPSGPFGTSDYRMSVELVPFEERALLHLSYGYSYGVAATMAMETYLATLGRNKVGFTVVGLQTDGQPVYVSGIRGVIERNVMRYYFAFDAYLRAQRQPPAERLMKSLQDWFDATERFPRQLHEVTRNEYLAMKLHEFERQQATAALPQ
jgi:hypothetical protein